MIATDNKGISKALNEEEGMQTGSNWNNAQV